MKRKIPGVSKFMNWSAKMAGYPITFVFALCLLSLWFVIALIIGFSNTWLLIINTIATINAALMVFIIQNTQIKESKALHIKIDELIRATKRAENELIAIEEKEEEELDEIRKKILQRRSKNEDLEKGGLEDHEND